MSENFEGRNKDENLSESQKIFEVEEKNRLTFRDYLKIDDCDNGGTFSKTGKRTRRSYIFE